MHDQSSSPTHKNVILIVNLGTPDTPTYWSTMRYLQEFLSDRRVIEIPKAIWYPILYGLILRFRSVSSSKKYLRVFDQQKGLPLRYLTQDLVKGINDNLNKQYNNVECIMAMRYGNPHISKIMQSLANSYVKNLYILPLFPQYSATTTATIMDIIGDELKKWRYVPNMQFIHGFWENPIYIKTICNNILEHWQHHQRAEKLLLSFHGLPERNLQKGCLLYTSPSPRD